MKPKGHHSKARSKAKEEVRDLPGRVRKPREDSREADKEGAFRKEGIGDRSGPGLKKPGL